MKIITYNPKKPQVHQFSFYVLSKGIYSGRPMKHPCANCFIVIAESEFEKRRIVNYVYILWKSKAFEQLLIGSVILFLRITDFKKLLVNTINDKTLNHDNIWFCFSMIVTLKRKQAFFKEKIRDLKVAERTYIKKYINF
jgi:hypothetical protein